MEVESLPDLPGGVIRAVEASSHPGPMYITDIIYLQFNTGSVMYLGKGYSSVFLIWFRSIYFRVRKDARKYRTRAPFSQTTVLVESKSLLRLPPRRNESAELG